MLISLVQVLSYSREGMNRERESQGFCLIKHRVKKEGPAGFGLL